MFAKSTVTFNYPKIRQLEKAQILALEQTAEWLHTEVVQAQVVPFDTGNLQNESMFVDYSNTNQGQATIIHATVYARRLYYHPEYNFQTTNNPYAKGKWFEDWVQGGSKSQAVTKAYGQLYKRLTGV